MKRYIHRIASYTALILFSSLPISLEALADAEKEMNSAAKSSLEKKSQDSTENTQAD